MEYYSAIIKKEILSFVTRWMDLEGIDSDTVFGEWFKFVVSEGENFTLGPKMQS